MKIALAQLTASEDKQQNLAKARQYIRQAAQGGADLVLLPEGFMAFISAASAVKHADIAEPLHGGVFIRGLMQEAKACAIYVVCGVYQSAENQSAENQETNHQDAETRQAENSPAKVCNTTIMLNRHGELIYSYQKTHLYDAFAHQESRHIIAGNNPLQPVDTEFGKIGLLVCYELRFPEVARSLTLAGAELLLVPTAWVRGPLKEEHYHTLVKARALENTLPVCACDQTGNIYIGRSLVCDALGVTIASAGYEEGLLFATLSPQHTQAARQQLPCVQHRRPDLYTT